jgi:hypothetical protein
MPQIPRLQTQNISTNSVDLAQGPSIARSDITAEAWAQLGNTVANIGEQLMEKRKKSDTSSFLNSKKNELSRLKSAKTEAARSKYTKDPTGYSAEINNSLKEWGDSQTELSPNDDAKQEWDNYLTSYLTESTIEDKSIEDRNKARYHAGLIDEDVYKNRQVLAQKPDPTLTLDFVNNTAKAINDGIGVHHDQIEAKEKLRKYGSDYTGTLLEGFENSKNYGQGLRFLNGKDPESKALLEFADPKQIQAYKDRFTRLGEQEMEMSKRVLNTNISDVSNALMQGMSVPDDVFNSLSSQVNMLKPEEKSLAMDNLNSAKQYNSVLKDIKTLPVNQLRNMATFEIPRKEGDIFNLTSRQQMASMYQKAASDMLTKKLTDGATFAAENDRDIKNLSMQATDITNTSAMKDYATKVESRQKVDGVTNIKILNKNMSATYGAIISSPNPEAANNSFISLRNGYGDKFGNVVSEMVINKSITPDHAMAMYLDNDDTRKQSFANISKKKEIDEAYTKVSKTKSELTDVFNDPVIQDLKKTISVNDPTNQRLWLNNGMDNLLELEYKNMRVNGVDASKAKEEAIKKVISKNFSTANSRNSSVILTRDHIQNKSQIQDYMAESLSDLSLRDMKFSIPDNYKQQSDILGVDAEEQYKKDLAKNGVWLSNSGQNGARLAKLNKDGKYVSISDASGNPIEVSFNDMVKSNVKKARNYQPKPLRGF